MHCFRLLFVVVLTAAAAWPQAEHPVSGRRIAPVMGMGGAEWLERNEREMEDMPEAALDALGIKPGMVVADVGAGVGYYTLRLARRVGPTGKVYANDVQPDMLTMLRQRAEAAGIKNIQPRLGSERDPKIPKGMDLILMVDVYHELSQPQRMLQTLRQSLKPDGRLILIEYRKEDPHIPVRPDHKMSVAEAKAEVEAEGYRLVSVIQTLPRQHIFVFQPSVQ